MHELTQYDFELPSVEDVFAGDSRTLAFRVVDADGDGVDLTGATIEWRLFEREYQDKPDDAILTGDDESVEIVTDERANLEHGEWEVRLDPDATADLWGKYYHRPIVTDALDERASWRGEIILTA